MNTRLILAAPSLAAGTFLLVAPGSDATAQAPAVAGHLWCFSHPHFDVEAVTCIELPAPQPR